MNGILPSDKAKGYYVTHQEIATLRAAVLARWRYSACFKFALGAAVPLTVTLATAEIANPKIYAAFLTGTITSILGAIYFGLLSRLHFKKVIAQIESIKQESVREYCNDFQRNREGIRKRLKNGARQTTGHIV